MEQWTYLDLWTFWANQINVDGEMETQTAGFFDYILRTKLIYIHL